MIVIVRERLLRCRRTYILDVGESILDVGEQTVGETTAIPFFPLKLVFWIYSSSLSEAKTFYPLLGFFDAEVSTWLNTFWIDIILDKAID